ncbi:protoheme IX farnesyltransferase [Candidatus Nitrosarchaeum limnium SFB1]|uniref:Protoheme IX farnesyltransferase n=1 Tax=Candidatus Nitrosarchaeum limnium SFB1 TaxID=886738 RepID=F3KLG8_9ARCH|nr:protoheme IX farnesyltransferase [Candidatus Nitrosarchaeum limnium SFB1]
MFTAFGATLTASNIYNIEISLPTWALMLFSVAAGSAAANTLTNYHDRDIDAIMERTKNRPLPSKRIHPAEKARNFGLALAGISLVLAFAISFTTTFEQGIWATVFIAFGLVNNILVYSYMLKRNSRTNIILGGLCGGSPPMIGWVAVTTTDLWTMGLAMAGLVFIWIPMHIWALTLHFKEDYNKVNVPMLTAVQSEKTSARAIAGSTFVMVLFSLAPFFLTTESGDPMVGSVYLWTAIASGALMIGLSIWVIAKPMEKAAWTLFKFSSPYLAVLFIALMVDSAL